MDNVHEALLVALDSHRSGRLHEAESICREVLRVNPEHPAALHLMGAIALQAGRSALAVDLVRRAVEFAPEESEYYLTLGLAYAARHHYDQAIVCLREAADREPGSAAVMAALGEVLWRGCMNEESMEAFRRACELDPADADIHSRRLLVVGETLAGDPQRVAEEHRQWAARFAEPMKASIREHTNPPVVDRHLRIGYVSSQFRDGATAFFLEPAIRGHSGDRLTVFCYSDALMSDATSEHFRTRADGWHETGSLSDHDLAELIRADRIDILVNIDGHLPGGRLLAFAEKPAPIQVSWLGYHQTTGLGTIDYRLSDEDVDPAGMTEGYFSERVFRLPRTGQCYRPADNCPPASPLPAWQHGWVTFGATSRMSKVTDEMVAAWGTILQGVPSSRMILQSDGLGEENLRHQTLGRFAAVGITPDQLELHGWEKPDEYLRLFHRIDIALDSFPYNARVETCHALWMGVPVVTLAGGCSAGRMGAGILRAAGLKELVAATPEEYIRNAIELARDLPGLAAARDSMRQRLASSALMDAEAFSEDLAKAYGEMWREWCEGKTGRWPEQST